MPEVRQFISLFSYLINLFLHGAITTKVVRWKWNTKKTKFCWFKWIPLNLKSLTWLPFQKNSQLNTSNHRKLILQRNMTNSLPKNRNLNKVLAYARILRKWVLFFFCVLENWTKICGYPQVADGPEPLWHRISCKTSGTGGNNMTQLTKQEIINIACLVEISHNLSTPSCVWQYCYHILGRCDRRGVLHQANNTQDCLASHKN